MNLKDKTGAGIKDCKEALEKCKGDMEKAIAYLREKGIASAAKKADRIAAEGTVGVYSDAKTGVIVEVNSETDFAGKSDKFQALVKKIAEHIAASKATTVEALLKETHAKDKKTINDIVTEAIATIGEKISIRRFERFTATGSGVVCVYSHFGKIGVVVELSCEKAASAKNKDVAELGKNVAMQIAASNPLYLDESGVPTAELEKERDILRNKAKAEKKPDNIIEKMLEGQVKKYYGEVCLVHQAFIKDPSKKISNVVAETGTAAGDKISIKRFARFELGEGIEKKVEDFAEEVKKAAAAK